MQSGEKGEYQYIEKQLGKSLRLNWKYFIIYANRKGEL